LRPFSQIPDVGTLSLEELAGGSRLRFRLANGPGRAGGRPVTGSVSGRLPSRGKTASNWAIAVAAGNGISPLWSAASTALIPKTPKNSTALLRQLYEQGDLSGAIAQTQQAQASSIARDPQWAWRFRLLKQLRTYGKVATSKLFRLPEHRFTFCAGGR